MEIASPKIRKGYRQTEVGVIPDDWKVETIIDATSTIIDYRGRTPKKIGMTWVENGNILALSANNVQMGTINKKKEANYGDESLYKRWMERGHCEIGDVVFTTEAPMGNIAQVPDTKRYILSQRVVLLRPREIDKNYFYWILRGPYFTKSLNEKISGSTAKGIKRKTLEELSFGYTSNVNEQRFIASILSDIDSYIDSLSKLVEKKRNIKTATMQQLLTGKKRLPGFSGEWKEDVMGKFGTCIRGVTYNSETDLHANRSSQTITLLRANNIKNELINTNDVQFVSSAKVKAEQVMVPGDIMICMANGSKDLVGKAGLYKAGKERNTFGSFMSVFRVNNNDLVADYTYYLLQTYSFRKHIANVLAGSSINNLRPSNIENFQILLPPKEEQEEIVSVLNDQHNEIFKLTAELEKITKIKYGMINELLTGNIRLA